MFSLILLGRRSRELHQWRNWRSAPVMNLLLQNAYDFTESFSSIVTADTDLSPEDERKRKSYTVSYLVDSLGLTTKLAESISMKANFEEKENPEKSLRAKLHFLKLNGASKSELTEIVSKVPKILGKRGGKSITVYYDYVKDILQDQDESTKSPKRKGQTNRSRNLSVLRELGVPEKLLLNLLISKAKPICGKERFEESVKKIVEMGFDPTSPKFVSALFVFYELSDKTIEHKVNVYKRLGLSADEAWAMFKKWPFSLKYSEKKITQTFETLKRCGLTENEVQATLKRYPECVGTSEEKIVKSIDTFLELGFTKDEFLMIIKRHPQCIGLAADTVKKKTEYLVKTMGWPLKSVASTPIVLGFSLEKFIFPRCNIIKDLMLKGLVTEIPAMSTALTSPKVKFLKIFVKNHENGLKKLCEGK